MSAKILYFPGCEMPDGQPSGSGIVIADEDFDDVRTAIEQGLDQASTDLGQCETEAQWIAEVNSIVEVLLAAALRKVPDSSD